MVISMIKTLKGMIYRRISYMKWAMQKRQIKIQLDGNKDIASEISESDKIVIISPHPDDELISCFNTILQFNKKCTIIYAGLTGYNPEDKKVRTNEFQLFCTVADVECIVLNDDWTADILDVFLNTKFDAVFIPSCIDWHWEHRKVCSVVMQALDNCNYGGKLFWYQVTVPIPAERITHFKKFDSIASKNKWQLFKKVYISQNFMPLYRLKQTENRYLIKNKRCYAEVFWEIPIKEGKRIVNALIDMADFLDSGKSKINNLLQISEFSNFISKELSIDENKNNRY